MLLTYGSLFKKKIEVTLAILRLFGKIPEYSDWFIITVIHLDISLVINFKSSEEIPSWPLLVEILVFL